jgi:hypothetical protein
MSASIKFEDGIKYRVTEDRGGITWRRFDTDELHREGDLPAIVTFIGAKQWYRNGKRHREGDKPALVYEDFRQEWWVNGERHREGDKPALVYEDFQQEWWVNGERHREGDKPALFLRYSDTGEEMESGWYKHGKKHRDGLRPAVIMGDEGSGIGYEFWRDGNLILNPFKGLINFDRFTRIEELLCQT